MADASFRLGIDLGTTSVKIAVVEDKNDSIVFSVFVATEANVRSDIGQQGNEQNVQAIMRAVNKVMMKIPEEYKCRIKSIGVCGQMHGCLLWQSDCSRKIQEKEDDLIHAIKCSNLYTWQDDRCNVDFLNKLPKSQSRINIATGFGCATIFWLLKNRPDIIKQFDRASTIQDFLVCVLCNTDQIVMSAQNAASWGYFDTLDSCWETELLKQASFPIHLLPKVSSAGKIAGNLHKTMWGIAAGIPVGVAAGDMQCSIFSALKNEFDAVMNISTSAQLAFPVSPKFLHEYLANIPSSVQIQPFFDDCYIAVAAALNGGNAFATFIDFLSNWMKDLNVSNPPAKEELYERTLDLAASVSHTSSLNIEPILLGERHDPQRRGRITNITNHNLNLPEVANALLHGIVFNLQDMMPKECIHAAGIRRIIGSGRLLASHVFMRQIVENTFGLPIAVGAIGDAAAGAAISVLQTNATSA